MKTDTTNVLGSDIKNTPEEWEIGDVILNLYEVQEVFKGGAMGLVYKVFHRNWRTLLAVKSPRSEHFQTKTQTESFIQECETWIKLGLHPNIVSCYYVREINGIPRVFCEFIAGASLQDWINNKRLYEGGKTKAIERILDIAIQFARGLHYAHEAGLVHQDVKPGNVMMHDNGTPLISDFGLAKAIADFGDDSSTNLLVKKSGYTPAYCSPEQANGKLITKKTDIWSWAVSILEMFNGGLSWQNGQLAPLVLDALQELGPPFESIPAIPSNLTALLKQCLEFDPNIRPKDMLGVSYALQNMYSKTTGKIYQNRYPRLVEIDAGTLCNKAISLIDLGKDAEAESLFKTAIAKHPGNLDITYNYCLMQMQKSNISTDTVLGLLDACGAINEQGGKLDFLKAKVFIAQGNYFAAEQHLTQARISGYSEIEYGEAMEIVASNRTNEALKVKIEPDCKGASSSVPLNNLQLLYQVCHIQSTQQTIQYQDRARFLIKRIDISLDLQDYSKALERISEAQSLPGYSRCKAILDLKKKIAPHCTITKLRDAWERFSYSGHFDQIVWVGFSAGEKQAVTCSKDGTIQTLDINTGAQISLFKVNSVSSNPVFTGKKYPEIIYGTVKGSLGQWDSIGFLSESFSGHSNQVSALAITSDLKLIASASYDHTLRLWDLQTGKCICIYSGHSEAVLSVKISSNDKWLLSGSKDKTVKLWDLKTGKCLQTYMHHRDIVTSVVFGKDAKRGYSGSMDGTIVVFDLLTGRELQSLCYDKEGVLSISLNGENDWLASGSVDSKIKVWDIAKGVCLQCMESNQKVVSTVCFSSQGWSILCGSENGIVKMWDLDWELDLNT